MKNLLIAFILIFGFSVMGIAQDAKPAKKEQTKKEQPKTKASPAAKAAAPAKAENKRPARSRKPKTETKPVDLAAVGLQLVETKTDAPKATASVESTKPKAPRKAAAWQKNTKEEGNPEPLVMVETQNK